MLGAHDLEDFYELQDEDRSARRHAPPAEEARTATCPLCRLDMPRSKLRLMPTLRWHRGG